MSNTFKTVLQRFVSHTDTLYTNLRTFACRESLKGFEIVKWAFLPLFFELCSSYIPQDPAYKPWACTTACFYFLYFFYSSRPEKH